MMTLNLPIDCLMADCSLPEGQYTRSPNDVARGMIRSPAKAESMRVLKSMLAMGVHIYNK